MSDQQMVFHHNWADDDELIPYLASEAYFGRLTFMLGAGLSVPFGLPDWEALIIALEADAQISPSPKFDLTRRAEYLLTKKYADDERAFGLAVRERLYRDFEYDTWTLRANRTLSAVASLAQCIAVSTRMAQLITLNFDDLLEEYLRQHGFVSESVVLPDGAEVFAPVHVLHPHAMLPVDDEDVAGGLVFDRRSFSKIITDDEGWKPKLHQALKGRTCLLIGLSGLDDHLDALLTRIDEMRRKDPARLALPYWAVWLSTKAEGAEQTAELLLRRGVFTRFVTDYEAALPEFLFSVCTAIGLRNAR